MIVRLERMIRLLLIGVIATHVCVGYSAAATATVNDVLADIRYSICHLNFYQQAFLYLHFCANDGFDRCGKL